MIRRPHKVLKPRGMEPAPAAAPATGLLVVHAAELVTLRGPWARPRKREEMRDLGIIADGAVYIEGGRVREVGDSRDVLRVRGNVKEVIDATGKVVLPGFVD